MLSILFVRIFAVDETLPLEVGWRGQFSESSSCSISTITKSGRCASMSEAIAFRIERQLHAWATPQRPPSFFGLAVGGYYRQKNDEFASDLAIFFYFKYPFI